VSLGTRQVGEVQCIIENPDLSLIPGTNINAEIRSRVVENAVTLPKEALRREGDQQGVLKLDGNRLVFQAVQLGVASVTKVQVVAGLKEGDAVAMPTERPLKAGDTVEPVFR
jgi:multidrug efflux pump subunit AcrA (membrane-fusion protein)